jgi:hypothetical protein
MKKTTITLTLTFFVHIMYAPESPICYIVNRELKKDALIADTFKHIESNNNYQAIGASGEYGAYQFMPTTWDYWSLKYYNRLLKPLPSHQDSVAIKRIRDWIEDGLTPQEIASYWNSGSPYWQNKIGVNSHGVYYNVPSYVNKFTRTYNMLKKKKEYWQENIHTFCCN